MPNFDMDALRTLVVAQQVGSLNRTADRIGRSQSAVSQQLRKLESQAGQPLFRREGRALKLTEAGDLVLSYARRILELNDEAAHALHGRTVEGSVRFGLSGDFAESWLPIALGQFKRTHPSVRVEIAVERNGLLLEKLDSGELDIALAMGHQSRSDAEHLVTLPMTWIGAPFTSVRRTANTPLDLALYRAPCLFRKAGTEALDKANISWRQAYTTANLQSLWAGVMGGLGITLRTAAGVPPTLSRLGEREGLPPLPGVDICLHSAGEHENATALSALKRLVIDNVMGHLGRPTPMVSIPVSRSIQDVNG